MHREPLLDSLEVPDPAVEFFRIKGWGDRRLEKLGPHGAHQVDALGKFAEGQSEGGAREATQTRIRKSTEQRIDRSTPILPGTRRGSAILIHAQPLALRPDRYPHP